MTRAGADWSKQVVLVVHTCRVRLIGIFTEVERQYCVQQMKGHVCCGGDSSGHTVAQMEFVLRKGVVEGGLGMGKHTFMSVKLKPSTEPSGAWSSRSMG